MLFVRQGLYGAIANCIYKGSNQEGGDRVVDHKSDKDDADALPRAQNNALRCGGADWSEVCTSCAT